MSSRASELRALGGLKWTYYAEDVLAAWIAEMDFGLAPPIAAALHDAVDRGLTGYPYPDLEQETARSATEFWTDDLGWKVEPEWVFPAPDVIEGMRRAIVHLTPAGSPVVLYTPVYFPFFSMVERAGLEIIEVPCRTDASHRHVLDIDGIDQGLAAGAGSVVLCNPWNPTGRLLSETELGDLVEVAAHHRARIIADEIHAPTRYDDSTHTPISDLDKESAVTVTFASKAWNLPGLRCAQVVLTNEQDREIWSSYFTMGHVGVATLGLVAGAAAYSDGRSWFRDVLIRLQANRDLLTELIDDELPDAIYTPPEATYLAWLDLSRYGLEKPSEYLRDRGTGGSE